MSEKFLGILKKDDPLFFYLNKMKELKRHNFIPADFYLVESLKSNNKNVYKYTANFDGTTFVVKFFGNDGVSRKRLLWEFNALKKFQNNCDKNAKIINPYCYLFNVDCALVEPYIQGKTLDYYIKSAIEQNRTKKLFSKLDLLANLLNLIHKSHQGERYNLKVEKDYCVKVLNNLYNDNLIDKLKFYYIENICKEKLSKISTKATNIHGDATTTNFIFKNSIVYAIDMEKFKLASFMLDLGFIVAEILHHFMLFDSMNNASEFVFYFLKQYSSLSNENFETLKNNLNVFVAIGLLRIARNWYLDLQYRHLLINQALKLVK